jgi:transposase
VVFEDYLATVEEAEQRLKRMGQAIADVAEKDPYRGPVGWLCCFRGVSTITAMTFVAELHGVGRFASARELMAYLGLVPSEHSSAGQRRQGAITKTGNSHLRRVLVEASWCQRFQPRVSQALRKRREGQPDWVIAQANRAMHRLHRRYWKLAHDKKPLGKVVVAVARELSGFLWAAVHQGEARQQTA